MPPLRDTEFTGLMMTAGKKLGAGIPFGVPRRLTRWRIVGAPGALCMAIPIAEARTSARKSYGRDDDSEAFIEDQKPYSFR